MNKKFIANKNIEIIGFDLGHGETAITKTSLYASIKESKFNLAEPKSLDINGKTSIITAVAMKNGKILIGDDAYTSKDVANLFVHFKSFHLENPEVREPIQNFVKSCLNNLHEQGKIKLNDNTYFVVGSPSGWTENDRNKYEDVLKKAGMMNVTVRPESRAAFLEAKESGELNESSTLEDSVLIIDIGSSTTDFTLVKNYEEKPLDFGHNNLGGGLLDIAIFNKQLDSFAPEKKVHDIFLKNPELKAQCLLKCREIKEKYFASSNEDYWIDTPLTSDGKKLDKELYFEVELYQKDMIEILNYSIDELDNKSWLKAFRDELKKCQESELLGDQMPKLVLLTGGASRMRFLSSICKEVFPPETKIRVGPEPSLTIARGLAYVGRIEFKVKYFIEEVEDFTT